MQRNEETVWEQIHYGDAPLVDLHVHPSLKAFLFKRVLTARLGAARTFNPLSLRSDFESLRRGGLDVLLSTVYAPEREIVHDCAYLKLLRFLMPITYHKVFGRSYFQVTWHILDLMEEQVKRATKGGRQLARMARSVQELDDILAQGPGRPIAVVHNVEGAHSLDANPDNLKKLFDRGVAYLTLAHFYQNPAVHPVFPYPETVQKMGCFKYGRDLTLGLTPFGEQVIETMIEMGMLLDISHCTPPARERIYQIVGNRMPLIASHVGAYEINPSPYNLKDWEIKRIADTGGVVAVIFMNYWLMPHETQRGLNFIAYTIRHLVNVGGIDHVGIGTDFDGFTDPPDDVKDASELPRVTQRLLAEGYSREEIEKIWGGNALRALRAGWRRQPSHDSSTQETIT
jgi:membrane dipeptidase